MKAAMTIRKAFAARRMKRMLVLPLLLWLASMAALAAAQTQPAIPNLNESGQIRIAGRSTPYLIRHLPIASFPQLPAAVKDDLSRRGCLIPQTYEAHRPENVIHGSFERAGSSDWAALCSIHGAVSLLVFFGSDPSHPSEIASAPETERLQAHDRSGVLGFNWGIDSASPKQVRQAQTGVSPRPPAIDHDAIAGSIVEHDTVYHYYSNGAWTLLPTDD